LTKTGVGVEKVRSADGVLRCVWLWQFFFCQFG
jgi:hypothetical protein